MTLLPLSDSIHSLLPHLLSLQRQYCPPQPSPEPNYVQGYEPQQSVLYCACSFSPPLLVRSPPCLRTSFSFETELHLACFKNPQMGAACLHRRQTFMHCAPSCLRFHPIPLPAQFISCLSRLRGTWIGFPMLLTWIGCSIFLTYIMLIIVTFVSISNYCA